MLSLMIELQTLFDGMILLNALKRLLHSLEINLNKLLIVGISLIKNDLIMWHIIKHLKKHNITQLPTLKVHNVLINYFYLSVLNKLGILMG